MKSEGDRDAPQVLLVINHVSLRQECGNFALIISFFPFPAAGS